MYLIIPKLITYLDTSHYLSDLCDTASLANLISSSTYFKPLSGTSIDVFLINHCVKNVRVRSFFDPHFPVFGLNTERYSVSLCVQTEYGNMRTRITQNTYTFNAVKRARNVPNTAIIETGISDHHKLITYISFLGCIVNEFHPKMLNIGIIRNLI